MIYTRFKRLEVIDSVSKEDIEQLAYETRVNPDNTFKYEGFPTYLPDELTVETTGVSPDDLDETGKDNHCQAEFYPDNGGRINMIYSSGLNHDNFVKARSFGAYNLIVPAFREFNPGYVGLMSLHYRPSMTAAQMEAHNISARFACELLAPRRDVAAYVKEMVGKKTGDELVSGMMYRYRIPFSIATSILKKHIANN